jgi:D-alanine-D-alanine ligase
VGGSIEDEPLIAVLSGGIGREREVSLNSGCAVAEALGKTHEVKLHELEEASAPSFLDGNRMVVFPAIHGTFGEDGELQSLLDERDIEYAGSGKDASRLCINKQAAKTIVKGVGIAVSPSVAFEQSDSVDIGKVMDLLGRDLVVKPVDQGSSVALHIVEGRDALWQAIEPLPRGNWMIEKRVFGRELTVGVLHGQALGVVEVIPKGGVFDYKSKYESGFTRYQFPAILSPEVEQGLQSDAETAFAACGCRDFARVDFIGEKDGSWCFLEVNTIPGLTETSLLPKSASCVGYDFNRLVQELVSPSIKRFRNRIRCRK